MSRAAPHWPHPRILAHRGGGTLAPENTLGGIRYASELGFGGVEFDVMLAGDRVPVLIHDETLDRTAGTAGRVPETPASTLAALDAGSWRGRRWRHEGIPTFEAAARLCQSLGLWANVEIKPARGFEHATGTAVAAMAKTLWQGSPLPPLLSSFSVDALAAAGREAPELARGYLVNAVPARWRDTARELDCIAIHCNHRKLTRAQVDGMHDAGYAVLAWTVNHRGSAAKLLRWGVDCLVTDALRRIGPGFAAGPGA